MVTMAEAQADTLVLQALTAQTIQTVEVIVDGADAVRSPSVFQTGTICLPVGNYHSVPCGCGSRLVHYHPSGRCDTSCVTHHYDSAGTGR